MIFHLLYAPLLLPHLLIFLSLPSRACLASAIPWPDSPQPFVDAPSIFLPAPLLPSPPLPTPLLSACLLPQVGFRHTEVRGSRLLHNGRPVMLRGVNRHEWDDRAGKVGTEGGTEGGTVCCSEVR